MSFRSSYKPISPDEWQYLEWCYKARLEIDAELSEMCRLDRNYSNQEFNKRRERLRERRPQLTTRALADDLGKNYNQIEVALREIRDILQCR